jgi:hypothetical protein
MAGHGHSHLQRPSFCSSSAGFDDLPDERLKQFFIEARLRDYHKLLCEAKKLPRIFSHAKAYRTPEADSPAGPGPSRDRLLREPVAYQA